MRKLLNPLEAGEATLRPQPHEDYGRLSIDLGTARTNVELLIHGDYLAKISYDGTATGCYFRLDHRHAAKVYAKEFKALRRRYARIYVTNTAQAGKVLVLQINELSVSEIEPDAKSRDSENLISMDDNLALIETDTGLIKTNTDAMTPDIENIRVYTNGMYGRQGVDGGGDLQKVKEELEKIVTDIAALEVLQGVDGAGDLQKVKEELELIKTAVQVMDDWDDGDHAKVVGPVMSTDRLFASTDAGTDTIAAPGAGNALEILGYNITEEEDATLAIAAEAKLRFNTSLQYIWTGILAAEGAIKNHRAEGTNLRIRGNENEALTLTNADRTAGSSMVSAIVYYRIVSV